MNKFLFSIGIMALFVSCQEQKNQDDNAEQSKTDKKENTMNNLKSGKNEVTFKSQGVKLAGFLFTPEGFDESQIYPTIIFSGPFNQVKEQMGSKYGKKFAKKGYVFLTYDPYSFGDSEGEPRNNEHAHYKMESIRDAISYLRTLPFVDREKLYGYGGCASGGYMALVAVTDKRLKAIATVSGMMDNQASYFGVMNKEQLMPLFEFANEARQKEYERGEVEYYDALNIEGSDRSREGYDYYMTERAGAQTYPNYSHLAPKTLLENAPITSAVLYAPYLYTPYLGIIGEKSVPKEGEAPQPLHTGPLTVSFYNAASEPKELFTVPGSSHVDLYDRDKYVDQAVAKMDEFFKKY